MWLLKVLISLPILTGFVLFLVQNNELVKLWPVDGLQIAVSVVYFVLFVLGYIIGRISAWCAYSPLRAKIKSSKKENKALSKEHHKLNKEHEKLNQKINLIHEEEIKNHTSFKMKVQNWFKRPAEDNNSEV